jgi:hypothetical protein
MDAKKVAVIGVGSLVALKVLDSKLHIADDIKLARKLKPFKSDADEVVGKKLGVCTYSPVRMHNFVSFNFFFK